MGVFDSSVDSANSLRTEGQEIAISFAQGVPASGQGTVEWTIPGPAAGCASGTTGVYAGIVVLLSTEPLDGRNIPQDGTIYTADPTANSDLSCADRIGNALVVAALYECELRSSTTPFTTTLVINDLVPGTAYFVAGYATDCQNRYHSDGVRTYSDVLGSRVTDIPARQVINLGVDSVIPAQSFPDTDVVLPPPLQGVLPTDGTGLIPGVNYEFDIIIDDSFPNGNNNKTVQVSIDGINAGTYQDLLDNINTQIMMVGNPVMSPLPPNTSSFFFNPATQELFQFDGMVYNTLPVLVEPTDPANVTIGSYWFDETNNILNRWNVPLPNGWNPLVHISSTFDPTTPDCNTYWFNNTIAREWNGTTWCDTTTIISATNPSACPIVTCGHFWYDENINSLFEWSVTDNRWNPTDAIFWPESPDQLSTGTYWYDDVLNTLSERTGIMTWNDITATTVIQELEPTVVFNGLLWYQPSTEELRIYSSAAPVGFSIVPVLVWPEDPAVVTSCELWWDSISDNLFTRDVVNSEWDQVVMFTQSLLDPTLPAPLAVDTTWYDSTNNLLFRFDGGTFLPTIFVTKSTDPTQPLLGEGWFEPTTNIWRVWDVPAAGWNVVDPVNSPTDPTMIPSGVYWFDTTTNALFIRNGIIWVVVMFTTVPVLPKVGDQWFDSGNTILNVWNGSTWVPETPCATAMFNENGGFTFTTTGLGSNNIILIPSPEGTLASTSPCSIGTGFAFQGVNDIAQGQCEYFDSNNIGRIYSARDIPENSFLWSNLAIMPNILRPFSGNDGVSALPSYATLGVGDDGSPDERRELMDSIRLQLGYPVVEVELTKAMIDTAITKALESFRKRSSSSTRRAFVSMQIQPGRQEYLMTNKVLGYNRIVNITAAYRFTSAFLSSAGGSGAFGQVVLQHLYNMGTYDLTSFFLISQYIEQLEDLFASRLTFGWHENNRVLSFYSSFYRTESILLDTMVERTEQDLLTDRLVKTWIEKYALSESMMMLAQIRGKFASLPGAGGGIALNAGELISIAQTYRAECMEQIEHFVVDQPEDVGQFSTFVLG